MRETLQIIRRKERGKTPEISQVGKARGCMEYSTWGHRGIA